MTKGFVIQTSRCYLDNQMWCHCWQSFWCAPYSHHQFILQNQKMLCKQNMKAKQRHGLRLFQISSSIPLSSSPSSNTKKKVPPLQPLCFELAMLPNATAFMPFTFPFSFPLPFTPPQSGRHQNVTQAVCFCNSTYILPRQPNATQTNQCYLGR